MKPEPEAKSILFAGVTLDLNGFAIIGPVSCTLQPTVCPVAGSGVGIQAGNSGGLNPTGVKISNGAVRGMGAQGLFLVGNGSFVEKVSADENAGGGFLVFGTVLESSATGNGSFGIFALTVKNCTSESNTGDGITLDSSGGVADENVSSFNGGRGIVAPNGTVSSNTIVRNTGAGISAVCPSSLVSNTVVNNGGTIQTESAGCILNNSALR